MKGHGREMIQLGIPVADALPDGENMTGTSKGTSYTFFNTTIPYTPLFAVMIFVFYFTTLSMILIKFHKLNLVDINVESIPPLFQDIIERLVSSQVMTSKPDACVVDFFNEVESYIIPIFFFVEFYNKGIKFAKPS